MRKTSRYAGVQLSDGVHIDILYSKAYDIIINVIHNSIERKTVTNDSNNEMILQK